MLIKLANSFIPYIITTTPHTILIIFMVFALNLVLNTDMTSVNPVNHRQDATDTPKINGVDCAAGSVT